MGSPIRNTAGPRLLAQAIEITASEHENPAWLKEARSRRIISQYVSLTRRDVSNDALRRLQTLEALRASS